eukprot:TRINITY_DN67919_c1_g1_i1.p1 TRINITY_DN67919_c1_g1~~TRINITY_DN67919_c1_g1_i1.p1  ORF type:complete len:453 (+),score=89.48 TRINITY_DN67919_c1_g1_i1:60-1361(+)
MMRSLLLLLLLATVTATTAASTPTAAEPATAFETPEMVDSMQPRSQAQAQAQAQSASREGKSSDSLLQVRDVAAAAAAPVEVKVRVHLRSLVDIKEVEQSVTAMFVVHMEWTDPKSANVSTQYGEKLDPKANWQPDIGVANAGSLMEVRKESMVLMPKHRVVLSRRIIANVQTQNKYEDFPFDTHSWKVFLMPFSYDATAVKLVPQVTFFVFFLSCGCCRRPHCWFLLFVDGDRGGRIVRVADAVDAAVVRGARRRGDVGRDGQGALAGGPVDQRAAPRVVLLVADHSAARDDAAVRVLELLGAGVERARSHDAGGHDRAHRAVPQLQGVGASRSLLAAELDGHPVDGLLPLLLLQSPRVRLRRAQAAHRGQGRRRARGSLEPHLLPRRVHHLQHRHVYLRVYQDGPPRRRQHQHALAANRLLTIIFIIIEMD